MAGGRSETDHISARHRDLRKHSQTVSTPPKVAIFLHDLRGGGAERMMVNLATEMVGRGISLDMVLVDAVGPYLDLLPREVHVIDLAAGKVAFSPLPFARYLRQARPNAVLSALLHINVAALIARMMAPRTRLVISERNTVSEDRTNISSPTIKLSRVLAKRLYHRADAIIAVSHGVAEDLSRFVGVPLERIEAINNPVVTPHLLGQAAEPAGHPWLDRKTCPVILAVGKFYPQKDFATLLRAFAEVRRGRKARLVIFGEGRDRAPLEQLADHLGIAADVAMPGFTDNPYAAMAKADLFVLSSRWEGSPNVLVEAMACGAPVVSTDCPSGPREILVAGKYGSLVPVGDASRLAAAMEQMLDSPTPAERLKARASDYSVERSTEGYLKILLPGWQAQDGAEPNMAPAR